MASRDVTFYLRSVSNVGTTLNLVTENWTFWNATDEIVAGPSNSTTYMYLTWDYDNSTLQPGEIIRVTFTLHARSSSDFIEFLIANDMKAFGFDIHISTSARAKNPVYCDLINLLELLLHNSTHGAGDQRALEFIAMLKSCYTDLCYMELQTKRNQNERARGNTNQRFGESHFQAAWVGNRRAL